MQTSNPRTPTRRSPITAILLLTFVVLAQACDGGASGSGHDAGSNATGGAASGGTKGGASGSGGAGTAGSGSGGSGVQAGTGGAGVGGTTRGTGGAGGGVGGGKGGAGGGTGGQGTPDASPISDARPNTDTSPALDGDKRDAPVGKDNGSADLAGDVGTEDRPARDRADSPADLPVTKDNAASDTIADSDAPAAASLDDCFAGLPTPVGAQIVSNKSSGDGRVHLRLALDTMGNLGLGYAWSLIRFGIEIDGAVTCIKDKTALKYTMSRHNCTDTASASSGTTRYEMGSPSDTITSLQIFEGGTPTSSMTLTTNSCTRTGSTVACPPTGPC